VSGTRMFNFREGDRSEYLATYALSALGLVTPVPRQEDIGFDLICSIADQDTGRLSFNHQYLVSVKSHSTPVVELAPSKTEDGSFPHVSWLFRLDLPLLLAVVDKTSQTVKVYSTLPTWFLHFDGCKCGALRLAPRKPQDDTADVGKPSQGDELVDHPGYFTYTVDLGHPVLCLSINDLSNKDRRRKSRSRLRTVVSYGRASALFARLGVPFFYWFAGTSPTGGEPRPAYYAKPTSITSSGDVAAGVAPVLSSLALMYKTNQDASRLRSVKDIITGLPDGSIPPEVQELIDS